MDNLQNAKDCLMDLSDVERGDNETRLVILQLAAANAAIAQAESLAEIAKVLDMIRESLGYIAQGAVGV